MTRRRAALAFVGAAALLFVLVWGGILLLLGDEARSTAYLRAMARLQAALEADLEPADLAVLIRPAVAEAGTPEDAIRALSAAWPVSGTGRRRLSPDPAIGALILDASSLARDRFPRSTPLKTLWYDALLWAGEPESVLASRLRRSPRSSSFAAEALLVLGAEPADYGLDTVLDPAEVLLLRARTVGAGSELLGVAATRTGDQRFATAAGLALLLEGDPAGAEAELVRLDADPLLLSYLAADRGDPDLALRRLAELPARRVAEPEILAWQADLLAFSGRPDELAPIYRSLAESAPGGVRAVAANAHIWAADPEERLTILRQARALAPEDEVIAERLLSASGGTEPAPGPTESDRLAVIRIHLGHPREPFAAFLAEVWEGVGPDTGFRAAYLGWHLFSIGDAEGLAVLLERVPRSQAPREWGVVSTLAVAGELEAEQTIASLDQLVEAGSWAAAMTLARAYRQYGDMDAAARMLAVASDLLRRHYPLPQQRGRLATEVVLEEIRGLAESGQRVAALDRLDELLASDPTNAAARELRRRLQNGRQR